MPAEKRSANLELVVTLDTKPSDRSLYIVATPVDDVERFVADGINSVAVRCWREGPTVIRGTITHASGAVAYFQGSDALAQMMDLLRLHIERNE